MSHIQKTICVKMNNIHHIQNQVCQKEAGSAHQETSYTQSMYKQGNLVTAFPISFIYFKMTHSVLCKTSNDALLSFPDQC